MAGWSVAIDLEEAREDGPRPTFLRIARAITDDIRRGRLRAGDPLPGARSLAASLGVHRNTVVAAYRELAQEGWTVAEQARGTFVSADIPEREPRRFSSRAPVVRAIAARPGFDVPHAVRPWPADPLAAAAESRMRDAVGRRGSSPRARARGPEATPSGGLMTLGGGVPDVRLVPADVLARALRRALKRAPEVVLAYGDPAGPGVLRRAVASMVAATRGIAAREEHVLVTRGSQMGIDLAARALLSPGDAVAVEALGYWPAWEALRAGGARLVPVPVDAHGMDVDALEAIAAREHLRGVYVTPHHQFPTTVTLAPARRLRLLELARERRMWILEDDYDHEFHYEGRPVLPLASADADGVVVYVGTLSKVLAPGMRIGFVVAPTPVIERLAAVRRFVDRQGDHLLAVALAELIEDGEVQRHVRRAKRIYAERRGVLTERLRAELGGVLTFEPPSGGTAIWARVARDVPVDEWARRALEEADLVLQPARQFAFDGRSHPFLRVGFAQHDARETREVVRRLVRALPARRR